MSRKLPPRYERFIVDLSDDKEKYLIGWPGYRNAYNRSGLGYIETQAEWAHMQGRLFRMMITGQVITRNPIFLLGMFIVGAIYSMPLVLGIPDILNGSELGYFALFIMSPSWIFGVLILRNVLLALTTSDEEKSRAIEADLDGGNSSAYNSSHQEE